MGQLQTAIGNKLEAYKAYRKVVAQNPQYELEFNARIAMTEVMASGKWKQMVGKLRRMARSDNNKDYLDQVYYAIGNIYMTQKDTLKAIDAYEKGNKKSTRNGIEKGVLLLTLGDIYWAKENFSDARRCYGEAIGLLDKDRKDYEQLSNRSKILDELVPHTDAVHLQDSLQSLAKMSEKERNEAIDRVIDALKKKEKEERDAQLEAEARQQQAANGGMANNRTDNTSTTTTQTSGTWYFYNPMTVSQGKSSFEKLWGKRENVDDWQRTNKTVVAQVQGVEEMTDAVRDSLAALAEAEDSLKQIADSAQNDPHKREYYLAQIPFTQEQVDASNKIIMEGLYNAGVIFKDKLDNLLLSEKALRRLADDYPSYEHMDNAYYHLFLLYSRMNKREVAGLWLTKLKQGFPDSEWTTLLSDPDFEENSRYGVHLEDSLYASTYNAFKLDRLNEVKTNAAVSAHRFPLGANRDKFIFFNGMAKLNSGDAKGCLADMQTVVDKYPKSEVSNLAGMIINGVKAGKKLHGGKFDISDVWARRSVVMADSDSIQAKQFTAERNVDFSFMIAYPTDSVDGNQLLYELAKYNFSNFLVRNFEIATEEVEGLERMVVSGFKNYDEALQYARQLYSNVRIRLLTSKCRTIIISDANKELLGTHFSYNDYDKFYEKHFIPLRISTVKLLTEPETIEYEKVKEPETVEPDKLVNGGVIDDDTFLQIGIPVSTDEKTGSGGSDIPADNNTFSLEPQQEDNSVQQETFDVTPLQPSSQQQSQSETDNMFSLPEKQEVPSETKSDDSKTTVEIPKETPMQHPAQEVKAESKSVVTPSPNKVEPTNVEAPQTQTPKVEKPNVEDNGIHFNDDIDGDNYDLVPDNNQQKQQNFNLEDDYYELDGF